MINHVDPVPNETTVRQIGTDRVQVGLADNVKALLETPAGSNALAAAIDTVSTALEDEISNRISAVSREISNRTSADNALSTAIDVISNMLSAVSARSIGDVSTHGLQSVVDALSNRISAAGGGGGSVTSQEVSALVQVASAAATSADAHAATASAAATSADAHANTASDAATSADAHANTVSARVVSVSAELASLVQIASAAATSADSHANTVSARVVSVSAELGSLIQIASAAATSADNHANTVSAAANTISARVVSVSAELASLVQIASAAATSADAHANIASAAATSADAHAATASAAATSADGHANTVSARAVSISAELGSLIQIASAAATSADGHANTVSARAVSISAELVSLLNSVENRLSDRIDAVPGGGSTNVVRIRSNVVSVVSGVALVDLAGLSVSVSVGVLYKLEGAVMFEKATSGGAAFGVSLPPMAGGGNFVEMKVARLINQRGNMENSTIQDRFWGAATFSAVAALQTAIVSVSIEAVNTLRACEIRGMIITSATGTIQLMARGSVANDSISVRAGYLRVYKLG